jgi:hypothetical protein
MYSFTDLLDLVDRSRQDFLIGFKMQTDEQRRQVRQGRTGKEHINDEMAELLVGERHATGEPSSGCCSWRRWLSWLLPLHVISAAVRGYSSTQRFTHCEVAFWANRRAVGDDERNLIAVGVTGPRARVFVELRAFSKEYVWVYLNTHSDAHLVAMIYLASKLQGTPFDGNAMTRVAITPGPDTDHSFFCSQLTMKFLSLLPVPAAQFNRPNAQTIDDINEIVHQSGFAAPRDSVKSAPAASLLNTDLGATRTISLAPSTQPNEHVYDV